MRNLLSIFALIFLLSPTFVLAQDLDNDGVDDAVDVCPNEDSSGFDADGDGCIDPTANTRHVETWDVGDFPITFVIHENGAPLISDGSDFTAIQDGFDAWASVVNSPVDATYGGTTAQFEASGLDGINLVTFEDPEFAQLYSAAVLAVGITTSFDAPTEFLGRDVRPGQIVDADIIFNPIRFFSTETAGQGPDLGGVTTHEAGHAFGISHSSIRSATMFPALPGGLAARSLESDDEIALFMAHPEAGALATANILAGTVTEGGSGLPIPGAAVFAIDVASGDSTAVQYTFADGSYRFSGLPDGSYHVFVHPLDGTSGANGVVPGLINPLVEATAQTLFVPEYWDAAESATDDSQARDVVELAGGAVVETIDIVSNVDAVAPGVTEIRPQDASTDVRTDSVVLVRFDEPIEFDSVSTDDRFRVERLDLAGPVRLGGSLVLLGDERTLVFNPTGVLDFEQEYRITVDPGVLDRFGNASTTTTTAGFFTEPSPAVALASLAPAKGVSGALLSVNGIGFDDATPGANVVEFASASGGATASVVSASRTGLLVNVPGLEPGDYEVTVRAGGNTSAALLFTVLAFQDVNRASLIDTRALPGVPRVVSTLPDGNFAYAGTSTGVSVFSLSPTQADFGQEIATISLEGGVDDLVATPDGRRVYAVSRSSQALHVIDSDYVDLDTRSGLFNRVLDTIELDAVPLGIGIAPSGGRAYVPQTNGTIAIWDTRREILADQPVESVTYNQQIGEIDTGAPTLRGTAQVDPTGTRLLTPTIDGMLLVHDLTAGEVLLATVDVGSGGRDVVVDPQGSNAYVSDDGGAIAVVSLTSLTKVQDISLNGTPRGLSIAPDGSTLYAADPSANGSAIVDLRSQSSTFRSVVGSLDTGPNTVDVAVSPNGLYVYAVDSQSSSFTTSGIGFGPVLTYITPTVAKSGDIVLLRGEGFPIQFRGGGPGSIFATVLFGDTEVPARRSTAETIEAEVPFGFAGGPVRVKINGAAPAPGEPAEPLSNPLTLRLAGDTPDGVGLESSLIMNLGNGYPFETVQPIVAVSPRGDLLAIADDVSSIRFYDIDPSSPTYLDDPIGGAGVSLAGQFDGSYIQDIVFAPDGLTAYVWGRASPDVVVLDTDRINGNLGAEIGRVDTTFITNSGYANFQAGEVLPTLDNELVFISDRFAPVIWLVDVKSTSPRFQVFNLIDLGGGQVTGMTANPNGRYVYVVAGEEAGSVYSIGTDPLEFDEYLLINASTSLGDFPHDVAVSPDGTRLYVGERTVGFDEAKLEQFDVTAPFDLNPEALDTIEAGVTGGSVKLEMNPRGDRLLFDTLNATLILRINTPVPVIESSAPTGTGPGLHAGLAFSPDGRKLYSIGPNALDQSVVISEFSGLDRLEIVSGADQVGIAGEPLPAPVVVGAFTKTGQPVPGLTVLVTEKVQGFFDPSVDITAYETGPDGRVRIDWAPNAPQPPELTVPINTLEFRSGDNALEVASFPVSDPSLLPLEVVQTLPADETLGVSVNTATQVVFTRAVDRASVTAASIFLRPEGGSTVVPAAFGFASGNRNVSLTPLVPLDFETIYELVVTTDVAGADGSTLGAGTTTQFATGSPPPLALGSIRPPAAAVGAKLTISGSGFGGNPSALTVQFNGVSAVPTSGKNNSLEVQVPIGAASGAVQVISPTETTAPVQFTVLIPNTEPLNEIVQTVDTGITTQGIAVTPGGEKAYAVSTETNQVLPVDLTTFDVGTPIDVGNDPVSIIIDPAGEFAYVANFTSGTLSVISVAADAVVETIPVGPQPFDIVMAPTGDKVYVLNTGDQTVSVVDADGESATYRTVTASFNTGSSTKGAAISPDGTLLYVGTSTGFLVVDLDPSSYTVVANFNGGSSTKGAAITPDGTLLILVTAYGEVLVVDITSVGAETVIANFDTGSSTKGAAISPDGGLIYLLQEDTEEILIVALEVTGSVSVLEDLGTQPIIVTLRVIGTATAGSNPAVLAFDPSGSGLAVVSDERDGSLTILNTGSTPFGTLDAVVEIDHRDLAHPTRGRYIFACIELPPPFSVTDIDFDSVRLAGSIPIIPGKITFGDKDQNGITEVCVEFDRVAFEEVVPIGDAVEVCITGTVGPNTKLWEGCQVLETVRPTLLFPIGGEEWRPGETMIIRWTTPPGFEGVPGGVYTLDIHWSENDGNTWALIAKDVPNTGSYVWTIPTKLTKRGRIALTLRNALGPDIGLTISPGTFLVGEDPIPVLLTDVVTEGVEGDGRLRWTVAEISDVQGFHILRSVGNGASFTRLTEEPLAGLGRGASGIDFEFIDTDVMGNTKYRYVLQEVREEAMGFQHGPYTLQVQVVDHLDQNFPNGFNPRTTIRFSLEQEGRARLVVYDVRGRRVKTLIDGELKPDVYRVIWEGDDQRGRPVASGVYLYRLETERGFTATKKMTLVR